MNTPKNFIYFVAGPLRRTHRRLTTARTPLSPRLVSESFCAHSNSGHGFTLIETLVAISLLTIAIVAPMSLTAQSLASAYYARDQITAFYLAQEAIEAIRSVRDGNILKVSQGDTVDLLDTIPAVNGDPFTVDTRNNAMALCDSTNGCPPLQTDGTFYGYFNNPPQNPPPQGSGWSNTNFTRTVTACFMQADGTCNGTASDEVKIVVHVDWITGGFKTRTFQISDNLYRWVNDGSGAQ